MHFFVLVLGILLSLKAGAGVCQDLRNLNLSGSVVREVFRPGSHFVGSQEAYDIEENNFSIPSIEIAINQILSEGGEILTKVFVSDSGALFGAQEDKKIDSCRMFFIPIDERQMIVPYFVRKVELNSVEVFVVDPLKEVITYRKIP